MCVYTMYLGVCTCLFMHIICIYVFNIFQESNLGLTIGKKEGNKIMEEVKLKECIKKIGDTMNKGNDWRPIGDRVEVFP